MPVDNGAAASLPCLSRPSLECTHDRCPEHEGKHHFMAITVMPRPDRVQSGPNTSTGSIPIRIVGGTATAMLVVATSGVFASSRAVVAMSLLAMGASVLTWLALRRRLGGMTTMELYKTVVVWALPLLAARPLFSGDLWSYLAQGLTAANGLDPYRLGPKQALGAESVVTQHVSHYWIDTPAPYGPAWLMISRAVGEACGERLVPSVLLYRLIALAGVVLIGWALPRLARRVGVSPVRALWLGLLNPLMLWHLVAGAHNDAIMLGTILAGMEIALAARRRRPSAAGGRKAGEPYGFTTATTMRLATGVALMAVAASIKIVGITAICCVAAELARHHARPLRSVLVVTGGAGAGMVLFSAIGGFGWVVALQGSNTVHSWMSPTTAAGLVIGALRGAHTTATAVAVANVTGAVVCLPIVIRLILRTYRGRLDPVRALGLIFGIALLCGPVAQPWYLLWALLPLAATTHSRRQHAAMAGGSAVVALVLPPLAAPAADLVAGYLVAAAALVLGAAALSAHRRLPTGRGSRVTPGHHTSAFDGAGVGPAHVQLRHGVSAPLRSAYWSRAESLDGQRIERVHERFGAVTPSTRTQR
jgi:alpha-1,6-mannosyltransferase